MGRNVSKKKFEFKPFSKKQLKVLTWWTDNSPVNQCDTVIADGSIRAGKTVCMIDSFITWSSANFEYSNFIIAGRSMGALKRNVLQPMFEILNAKGIQFHYDRTDDPHVSIGTNKYYLFGASTERSQDTLQGLTSAGAYADEVALMPESFVNQMIGRCSVEGSKIFLNCNPESPHHFIKKEFIDKAEEKGILYIHFTMHDNPSLSKKVIARYERQFSGVWYDRYIKGLWSVAEGVVYDMFEKARHVIQIPDKYVYEDFYVSIDYGTSNVMAFLLFGIRNNTVYCLDEFYYNAKEQKRQKTDDEFISDFEDFVGDRHIRQIFIDPSAASFKASLRKAGYHQTENADNDVINGIRLVGTFLNTERLFISDKCVNLLREFFEYRWDEKYRDKGIDKVIKEQDHALDALRYMIYSRYKNESTNNLRDRYRRYLR